MIDKTDFRNLSQLIHQQNWSEKSFSFAKASVCSMLSELAYCVKETAWKNKMNRINVIPYHEYRYIDIDTDYLKSEFLTNEIGDFFSFETKYAIGIGSISNKVIFIAIRGTIDAYDWTVNFNCSRTSYKNDNGRIEKYHRGFYKATTDCLNPIAIQIQEYYKKNNISGCKVIPIVVTGHSLGGAMAAIYNKIGGVRLISNPNGDSSVHYTLQPFNAYTFGMPRFGNKFAVHSSNLYHIYNEHDIVPTIPPKWMGFCDSRIEFTCDGEQIENISQRNTSNFLIWIRSLMRNVGHNFVYHDISRYRGSIESLLK